MNIFRIAFIYLKQNLKRPVTLILLTLCPVFLIIIVAQAFSGLAGTGSLSLDMQIGYYSPGTVDPGFREFTKQLSASGIVFEAVEDPQTGKNKVAAGEYRAFVLLHEKRIELFINANSGLYAGIIERILYNFTVRSNLYEVIARYRPEALVSVFKETDGDFITRKALHAPRQPRVLDYAGIIILTMAILFGSHLGAYAINREKILKTLDRIYVSPLKRSHFFIGITLGILATLIIQIGAVFLTGKYMLNIYYGDNLLRVASLLICECFFAIALGIGAAGLFKQTKASAGFLNTVIPVMIFLGGGYMKLPDTPVLNFLSRLSPLDWINKALFAEIYSGEQGYFLPAICICLSAGIFILVIAGRKMVRSEQI